VSEKLINGSLNSLKKNNSMKQRPKLLYLSQCFPLPLDGGGRIKTFNTLKTLSQKFEIFAIFVSERQATKKELQEFKKLKIQVKIFKTKLMAESIKEIICKLAWNYLQLRPHFFINTAIYPALLGSKLKFKIGNQTLFMLIISILHNFYLKNLGLSNIVSKCQNSFWKITT
jgi:hypothetical protein